MTAYVIGNINTREESADLSEYRRRVLSTMELYGGRFALRGARCEVVEGDWQPTHLSIMEFPDGEAARRWLKSPEYQAILPLRRSVGMDLFIAEGH